MSQRILVISHMYPNPVNPMSGIFVHNQCKALKEKGVEIQVVSPIPRFPLYPKWKRYKEIPNKLELDGIPVTYVPTWMFPGGFFFHKYGELYVQSLEYELEKIKKEFPFDLIHCHTIFPDGFAGGVLSKRMGVPVISTIHGSDIMLYPKRNQAIYDQTVKSLSSNDRVVTVSERLLLEAKKMVPDIQGMTIYNGFDPDRFYPIEKVTAREQLGLPVRGKNLLFVGNCYEVKGINYLLQAFAKVVNAKEDIHLYLVGDGPLRSQLEKQTADLGIGKHVSFMGRKPYEEIPIWIGAADALVLSSLSEGLPSILLESMGCGRPMIATEVGGIPEILKDSETGLLVKPRDVDGLVNAIRRMFLEETEIVDRLGEQAYQASKELTWSRNAEKLLNCYADVLKQKTL
jgi:teichuronic acid biosynthesis glycosyltransferase TuaC